MSIKAVEAALPSVTAARPHQLNSLEGSAMTPETARKNWNSRFSNIKNSFSAASEEELNILKSRSPSINRSAAEPPPQADPNERGRSKVKPGLSGSPNTTREMNNSNNNLAR